MKNFLSALRPSHVFILFLLIAAAIGVFLFSYQVYLDEVNRQLPSVSSKPEPEPQYSISEVRALFAQSGTENEHLDVIAKKNLFSADRRPWAPPEQDDDGNGEESTREQRNRYSHKGIRLYGTTLTDSRKMALVYFAPFQDKDKYRMVSEGETARDKGERGQKVYFKVSAIEQDSVELEDPAGSAVQVGLYDHQRQASKSPSPDSQVRVVIGGTDEAPIAETEAASSRQGGSASDQQGKAEPASEGDAAEPGEAAQPGEGPETGEAGQGQPEAEGQQNEKARNIFELFKQLGTKGRGQDDLNNEQKEQMVEEGRMRKVDTPFGTIYRPVD